MEQKSLLLQLPQEILDEILQYAYAGHRIQIGHPASAQMKGPNQLNNLFISKAYFESAIKALIQNAFVRPQRRLIRNGQVPQFRLIFETSRFRHIRHLELFPADLRKLAQHIIRHELDIRSITVLRSSMRNFKNMLYQHPLSKPLCGFTRVDRQMLGQSDLLRDLKSIDTLRDVKIQSWVCDGCGVLRIIRTPCQFEAVKKQVEIYVLMRIQEGAEAQGRIRREQVRELKVRQAEKWVEYHEMRLRINLSMLRGDVMALDNFSLGEVLEVFER